MSIHRTKHALVIGLGQSVKGYIDAINQQNTDQQSHATMRTLWLADTPHADKDLRLHKNHLGQLYYQDETVRAWSSANWWGWQDSVGLSPALRLSGKLAVYHQHEALDAYFLEHINALYDGQKVRLVTYLIAALYEPFASGALFDTAYLLHKLTRERSGRLFTVLLLPGIVGEKTPTPEERQLQGATTYATLRELGFLLGYPSFYQPHPKLRIPHKGLLINRSPFQSGDVFLVGGESVGIPDNQGSIGSPTQQGGLQALTEQQARQAVSNFIHLHSSSRLGDYLPHTERGSGFISTFGIVSEPAAQVKRTQETLQRQRDNQQRQVYQALLDTTAQDIGILPEVEQAISSAKNTHMLWSIETVKTDIRQAFEREIERPQCSLEGILHLTQQQIKAVQEAQQKAQNELDALEKQLAHITQHTHAAKNNDPVSRAALIMYFLPIWVSGLLIFWTLGWFIGFITWLTLGWIPVWMGYSFEQSIYQRNLRYQKVAATKNEETQKQVDQLKQVILSRLVALKTFVESAYPLAHLQTVLDNLKPLANTVSPVFLEAQTTEALLTPTELARITHDFMQSMLKSPPENPGPPSPNELIAQMLTEIEANRLEGLEMRLLHQDLPLLKPQTITLLGLIGSKIGGTQEHNVAILEVSQDATHVQRRLRFTDTDPETQTYLMETASVKNSSERQRHYIRVRTNIPLWALLNITDWQVYYQAVITQNTSEQGLYRRRAWLHPTRDGVATPDILITGHPLNAMLCAALLHLTEDSSKAITEQLAKSLSVPQSTKTASNYDELCGALQEQPDVLNKLVDEIDQIYQNDISAVETGWMQLYEHLTDTHPKVSQRYAAWEVWVYYIITQNFELLGKRNETLRQDMQRLAGALYHYFSMNHAQVQDNQGV